METVTVPGLDVLGGSILGVVLVLLITGWLWAKPSVTQLQAENKRLNDQLDAKDAQLAALRQGIEERVIPTVERNTHLAMQVTALLERRTAYDQRLLERLERIDGRGRAS